MNLTNYAMSVSLNMLFVAGELLQGGLVASRLPGFMLRVGYLPCVSVGDGTPAAASQMCMGEGNGLESVGILIQSHV